MTKPEKTDKSIIHYFVDEAGDPSLFNRKGNIIIETEGCSRFFILGKLDVEKPDVLALEMESLRSQLVSDPYFKGVPSMQPEQKKTAMAFHAKDDPAEVRREVFKLLIRHNFRFYAVVRDKRELVSYVKQENERNPKYKYNPNELYDNLVSELFRKLHRMADYINIGFSTRGKKDRTQALRNALEKAEKLFEQSFGFHRKSEVNIWARAPRQSTGLQAVDYYLWALQRFYEKKEDRYIELIWPQVGEIHDLDLVQDGKHGVFFRKDKPLNKDERPL